MSGYPDEDSPVSSDKGGRLNGAHPPEESAGHVIVLSVAQWSSVRTETSLVPGDAVSWPGNTIDLLVAVWGGSNNHNAFQHSSSICASEHLTKTILHLKGSVLVDALSRSP